MPSSSLVVADCSGVLEGVMEGVGVVPGGHGGACQSLAASITGEGKLM